MKVNLIYSETNDHVIGVNNDLYCKVSGDLKHFRKQTRRTINGKKNGIVTGYNTFKSIPTTLSDDKRSMIVISNNHYDELLEEGIEVYRTIDEIFGLNDKYLQFFIIGGSKIYHSFVNNYFDKIDLIYQTKFFEDVSNTINNITIGPIMIARNTINKKIELIESNDYTEMGQIFNGNEYITKSIDYQINIYQKKEMINHTELNYLKLLKKIITEKNIKTGRNGDIYSYFGGRLEFDLRESFPIITTKRMPCKTILRELLWFIRGSTSNKELNDKNVHIWDLNASREFLDSRNLNYKDGDLGPIYGFQWRHFGAEYKDCDTDYTNKGVDQLKWIIDEIKKNPSSRRLIMSAWNPIDLDKMALPPCHLMIQFNIDGEYIDGQMYQRSGDMFLGIPFNITSYSFLISIIGKLTGYIPRKFIHIIGDAHIYLEHEEAVLKQLERYPLKYPKLEIKNMTNIDDIHEDMFNIIDYQYFEGIKAPMIM